MENDFPLRRHVVFMAGAIYNLSLHFSFFVYFIFISYFCQFFYLKPGRIFPTFRSNAECFKKGFTTLKAYVIYSESNYSVSKCQNVAKHTKFYKG
jgi:hypothetical protein